MARPSVQVVLAHYSEDLSWTKEHEHPSVKFTVYSKSETPPMGTIVLPNVGRESHTYLHHIVHNYHRLADWTVFSQAVRPSWGYHGGGEASGHLSDRVEFVDYLQPFPDGRDSFFIFDAVSQFPSAKQTNRLGFMMKDLAESAMDKSMCPPGAADGWTPWWWDQDHPQLRGEASNITMLQFYHRFIARDEYTEKPLTLAFAQGARFAVSRDRIHTRPQEYYAALLEQLSRSVMPMEGYWMEAAWYDAFHPEALQSKHQLCTLPPDQDALTVAGMQAEILRRARERHILVEDSGERTSHLRSLSYAYSGPTTTTSAAHRNLCTLVGTRMLVVVLAARVFWA